MKIQELRKLIREEIKALNSPFSSDPNISYTDNYSDSTISSPELEMNELELKLNEFWEEYPENKGMSPDDMLHSSIKEWDGDGLFYTIVDTFKDYLDFDSALTLAIKNQFESGVRKISSYIDPTQKHISLAKSMATNPKFVGSKTKEIYDFIKSPKKEREWHWWK